MQLGPYTVSKILRNVLRGYEREKVACVFVTAGMFDILYEELKHHVSTRLACWTDKWGDCLYFSGVKVRAWSHPWCEGQTLPFVRLNYEG
jgi:hypothetical protein